MSQILHGLLYRSYSLFDGMDALSFGLIGELDVLSDFDATFQELFRKFREATFACEKVDFIIGVKIVFHQLDGAEVVSFVLFYTDKFLFLN
jgi:hypothetical protein